MRRGRNSRAEVLPGLVVLLAASMPAFLGGFVEDLTKQVRVLVRLGLAMFSGVVAYYFLGAAITRVDIIGIDWLLQFSVVSLIFTAVAIGGAANAINIIDGYNGLAAEVSAMILAGFAYVSFYLGDRFLLIVALSTLGALWDSWYGITRMATYFSETAEPIFWLYHR